MTSKTLIVYYSWSGNTKSIAEALQQETAGDLWEIKPLQAYPGAYNACVDQAKQELQSGFLPEIEALPDLSAYDTLFVGTPNWWSSIAPPVAAFLSQANLAGKTVAPFCSHGGGGLAHCAIDVAKRCPGSTMQAGLAIYDSGGDNLQQEITAWLEQTNLRG